MMASATLFFSPSCWATSQPDSAACRKAARRASTALPSLSFASASDVFAFRSLTVVWASAASALCCSLAARCVSASAIERWLASRKSP